MDFLGLSSNFDANYTVALGNFDGVHLGHREVIKTAIQKAKEENCRSAVITFSPHPAKVLGKGNFKEILSLEEKILIMKGLGIDEVIVINFTENFSKMPGEIFIDEISKKFKIKSITTGYNFMFGFNRESNINTINSLREKYNYKFNVIKQILYNGCNISSSILRQVIKIGSMKVFAEFTARLYSIKSKYISGNEDCYIYNILDTSLILPPKGIYIGKIHGNYSCLLVSQDKITARFLDLNIQIPKDDTSIEIISILGQELSLDKVISNKLKVESYIKKSKFCLSLEKEKF
jgi:riboflavin kinase/FMN adenylyltransferase